MDFSFEIAVNSDKSEEELVEVLCDRIPGAECERGCVKLFSNVLMFEKNPDFNLERSRDKSNGWEYFRYDCDVFPISETNLQIQQECARQILKVFNEIHAETEFLAEFEIPNDS